MSAQKKRLRREKNQKNNLGIKQLLYMMDKQFIGVEDLAKYLDVSINTLRSWVWQRQIPYFKVGRLVRFDMQEVENWLKDRKVDIVK